MLEIFWDVGSPYTYLLMTQLDGLRARTGVEVRLRPFLIGGVFKSLGMGAPVAIPSKARYLVQDLARWRKRYGVPMRLPTELSFPLVTLLPMRAAHAAARLGAGEAYCRAIFDAYWVKGLDVSEPGNIVAVAESIGLDGDSILAATAQPEIKDALRETTEEAVARGAFGAPTMFVGETMFFGNDRLEMLESYLLATAGSQPNAGS